MSEEFNDDVFGKSEQTAEPEKAEPAREVPEASETVETQPEGAQAQPAAEGAPTAPEGSKHVPLAALEAERKGRQDWKEKAIRFEEELKAMRNNQAQNQQAQNQPQLTPEQVTQQALMNERFNMSEMIVREKYADLDDVVNVFKDAAQLNPALWAQLNSQRHPWEFAYKEGKRLKMLQEMGDDPDAYRKKMRDEIMAEMQQQGAAAATQQPAPAAPGNPRLPQSLATERATGGRGASTFTGPTPFDVMFPN